jgi:hypothetical protein
MILKKKPENNNQLDKIVLLAFYPGYIQVG